MLSLAEQFLLLALDEENGKLADPSGCGLNYGLAGAVMAELLLQGKLKLDADGTLLPDKTAFTSDPLLDEALEEVRNSPKPRALNYWIEKLASAKLRRAVLHRLLDRGLLAEEERRALGIFPHTVLVQRDLAPRMWAYTALRGAALNGEPLDAQMKTLLSLAQAAGLLPLFFTRQEQRLAKQQIEALTRSQPVAEAVAQAVENAESAAGAVVILGAMYSG